MLTHPLRTLLIVTLAAAMSLAFAPADTTADGDLQEVAPVATEVVGEDPVGDWGGGGDNALVGHTLGQDLLSAAVGVPSADTVRFRLEVSWLPSTGGIPEFTRYSWNFDVDGEEFELDGKFTNYTRGACDPTSGQCPPPRDPGEAPFLLRGNCETNDQNVTLCEELALLHANFNSFARTITIDVPAELLQVGPCSVIAGGTNIFGGSVSAAPSAVFTSSLMPMDTMFIFETFEIPSADPENQPCES